MARSSVALEQDQLMTLTEMFESLDADGNGFIEMDELHTALEACGLKLPSYQVRDLVAKMNADQNNDGKIDIGEFKKVYSKLKSEKDLGMLFKKQVTTRTDVKTMGGSSDGITHTVKGGELPAYTNWINSKLEKDEDCKEYLPIDPESDELYRKCKGGILLCKLINDSVTGTIDDRTINKKNLKNSVYLRLENHNLALNSAQAIGCNVVNIGHNDLEEGKPHLVLGLLWQIIRIGLLSEINLTKHPGLVLLLEEGEDIDDLLKLSPEEILIRWVNYHLRNSQSQLQISNFTGDIKDSEAYTYLLSQIAPKNSGVGLAPMDESDMTQRAEFMLQEADKIDCRAFVGPQDVVKGNGKLNLAFVANLFNQYPALEKPDDMEIEIIEETREEKTYRNWMNSMGVRPFVNRLYSDLTDGQILFQLYDVIKPGTVDWNKVITKYSKMAMKVNFEKIENCNYAVDLGKELKFSLVGISGKDLREGIPTLTLGLVWQLMRAYTLTMLRKVSEDGKPVDDRLIVGWANNKLKEHGKKNQVSSFQDHSLSDSVTILNLIDCIAPKKVSWSSVKEGGTDEDKLSNAKYAISMGRKVGARIYALPEDIVEVKPKMIMTIFACLMTIDKDLAKTQAVE